MSDINKELLHRYLEGTCTPSEISQVEEFLRSGKSNELFGELLDEYWSSRDSKEYFPVVNNYYIKFKERYSIHPPVKKHIAWSPNYLLKYAAVLLLGIGAVFYFLKTYSVKTDIPVVYIKKYNPRGQRSIVTLPDGSIVYLGPDSRLEFPQNFSGHKREVSLQGEGFFEVKHQIQKPFIVHSNEVATTVLGTSFKIETFKLHIISVSVATGKVSVGKVIKGKPYKPLAVLTAGRGIVYNDKTELVITNQLMVNDLAAWKEGGMIFRDMTLGEICLRLERWYNMTIIIENGFEDYRMSASFGKASINEILAVITRTAGLHYTINNQIIHLKKQKMEKK